MLRFSFHDRATANSDRRIAARYASGIRGIVWKFDSLTGVGQPCELVNLSQQGVLIEISMPLKVGDRVVLQFPDRQGGELPRISGTAVRSLQHEDARRWGIHLDRPWSYQAFSWLAFGDHAQFDVRTKGRNSESWL